MSFFLMENPFLGLDWGELDDVEDSLFLAGVSLICSSFTYPDLKLDGVGPVDKRPSTDKLHHFVRKKKKKKM